MFNRKAFLKNYYMIQDQADCYPYCDSIQKAGQEVVRLFVDGDLFPTFETYRIQAQLAVSAHLFRQRPVNVWIRRINPEKLAIRPAFLYEWVQQFGYSRIWINVSYVDDEEGFYKALEEAKSKREEIDPIIKKHGFKQGNAYIEQMPEMVTYDSTTNELDEGNEVFDNIVRALVRK